MAQKFYQAGDRVDVVESALTHPTHTDGFVDANDPCIFGAATVPGVAEISAAAATDVIPVNIEGVFLMDVHGADGTGDAAVTFGDKLYYDATEVNVDVTNGSFFGIALGAVTSGATTEIPVKLGGPQA